MLLDVKRALAHSRRHDAAVKNRDGGWVVYHVTARGNERKRVFRDDKDRLRFLESLKVYV